MNKPLRRNECGFDGAVVSAVKVRTFGHRIETHHVRARPGTFEWRYGRNAQSPLYHAGSHFAQLWERAGIAVASSADFLRGTMSGFSQGLPDGRVLAVRRVSDAVRELGRFSSERLIDYCVLGYTTAVIASKNSQPERDIAYVLNQDLRSCAMHFRYL